MLCRNNIRVSSLCLNIDMMETKKKVGLCCMFFAKKAATTYKFNK